MADITVIPTRGDQNYTDYLNILNGQLAALTVAYNAALDKYNAVFGKIKELSAVKSPNWDFIQKTLQPMANAAEADRDKYGAAISAIKLAIVNVQTAAQIEQAAASSSVNNANANAALTQATANLSPTQLAALQQNRDTLAAQTQQKDLAAKSTNMYVIGAIVAVVIIVVFFFLKKKK